MTGRRLRILQLIYDHPDNPWCGGGGAGRAWAINRLLAERHDITVCCGHFPGAKKGPEPFDIQFLGKARGYIQSRLQFMWHAARCDASSFHLVVEEFSYYAPIMSRFSGRPLVSVLQGCHGLDALRYRGIMGLVSLFSEYLLLPSRRAVVLVSSHLKAAVHPDARTVVIGQGVDLQGPLPPEEESYVLYLGRLDVWHKGIDTLIAAWSQIPAQKRSLPLIIAGGGNDAAVRRLLDKNGVSDVRLTGRLSHQQALAAINKAAFVVMPSRMEGSPLVLYETLALGKPVVGTTIAPIAALLPHTRAGLLVPPENPAALSLAMRTLMANDALRTRMGVEAARIGARFQWSRRANEQERFYFDVIAERPREMAAMDCQ